MARGRLVGARKKTPAQRLTVRASTKNWYCEPVVQSTLYSTYFRLSHRALKSTSNHTLSPRTSQKSYPGCCAYAPPASHHRQDKQPNTVAVSGLPSCNYPGWPWRAAARRRALEPVVLRTARRAASARTGRKSSPPDEFAPPPNAHTHVKASVATEREKMDNGVRGRVAADTKRNYCSLKGCVDGYGVAQKSWQRSIRSEERKQTSEACNWHLAACSLLCAASQQVPVVRS